MCPIKDDDMISENRRKNLNYLLRNSLNKLVSAYPIAFGVKSHRIILENLVDLVVWSMVEPRRRMPIMVEHRQESHVTALREQWSGVEESLQESCAGERERNEGRWLAIVHFNILLRQWWCVTFVYSFIHFFRLLRLLLLLFERKLGRVHLHLPLLLPLFLPHSTNRFVSMSTFLADFSIQLLSTHFGLFCQISLLPSCCLFSLSSIFLSPNSNSFLFCARVCFKSVLAPTVPSFWNELGLFQWFRTHFPFGFGFFLMLLMIQSRLDSINFRFSVFTGVFFLFPFSFLFPFLVVLLYSHLLTNLCQCQPSFFLLFFLCLHFLFFFCLYSFFASGFSLQRIPSTLGLCVISCRVWGMVSIFLFSKPWTWTNFDFGSEKIKE